MGFPQEENWVLTQLNETAHAKYNTMEKKIDPPKKPKLYREFKTLFVISVTRFRHSVFFLRNKTIVYDVKLQTNKETKKRSSSLHSHVYFVSFQT